MARSGQSIGELIGEYQAGQLEVNTPGESKPEERSGASRIVDLLFEGQTSLARELLDQLSAQLSAIELIERLIEPAMVDIGERWFRGECGIYQERCATSFLFARIARLVEQARRANLRPTRSVLVGAVLGDRHEGGVLMVSLILELARWRSLTLGVDVPVEEYQKAIEAWHPAALALSFVLSRNINKRFEELSKIQGIPVFVGGRSIVNHQSLARRHGLIPLVGSLRASSAQLIREVEAWEGRNRRSIDRD